MGRDNMKRVDQGWIEMSWVYSLHLTRVWWKIRNTSNRPSARAMVPKTLN